MLSIAKRTTAGGGDFTDYAAGSVDLRLELGTRSVKRVVAFSVLDNRNGLAATGE